MANIDYPRGFQVLGVVGCSDLPYDYADLSATNSAIGINGFIEARSGGLADRVQASSVTIMGIAQEYKAANSGGQIAYIPIRPGLRLRAQLDGSDINEATDLFLNYDIVTGNPDSRGYAIDEIDASAGATTPTLPVKVLSIESRLESSLNPNAYGASVVVICTVNENFWYKGGSGV